MNRPPPQPQYNEYKSALKSGVNTLFSQIERNDAYKHSFKDKISNSHDIQTILDNKLSAFNWIENENIILGLTVVAKLLENRTTTPPAHRPVAVNRLSAANCLAEGISSPLPPFDSTFSKSAECNSPVVGTEVKTNQSPELTRRNSAST